MVCGGSEFVVGLLALLSPALAVDLGGQRTWCTVKRVCVISRMNLYDVISIVAVTEKKL